MNSDLFTLWPIPPFGGEDGDGDGGASGDASQGNSGDGTKSSVTQEDSGQQDNAGSTDGDGNDDADDDDDDEFKGLSAAELRSIARENATKAKNAESARRKAQAKIDAEERKKNDDATNAKKDLETERETVSTIRATMTKQAITGAIRDDTRFTWNDVEIVAGLLDPEKVKVSDEGKVEGLKSELTRVSKDHPFLLKTQGGQQNSGTGNGPTGFQPGQGGAGNSGSSQEQDRKALAENYPALAMRI